MLDTFLYFLILLLLLLFFIKKKSNVLGLWLFGSFLTVAFFALLLCVDDPFADKDVSNIVFLPYLLLIVGYLLYSFPFLFSKEEFSASKVAPNLKKTYVFFAILYVFCSIIVIYSSYSIVSFLVEFGDWEVSYREDSLVRYSNFIEYNSIIFTNYTRILAFVVGFLMLRKGEKSSVIYIIACCLILAASVTQIFNAIISTSRSMIFELIILLPAMYLFFCRQIDKKINQIINILFVVIFFFALYFFIDVTISRFESRGTYDSVISHFGQAPIVFNTQMYGQLDHFLWGEYTLGKLFENAGIVPASIGGLWDVRFYTFVGWLYVDWGGLGVVFFGVLLGLFFFFFIKKRKYDVSDLFLLFSYYTFLLKGVFVIGRSYIITIVSTVVIYLLLKGFVDFFAESRKCKK